MGLKRCLAVLASCAAIAQAQKYPNGTNSTSGAIYKDPSASIDDRVSDLLKHMTIEDKTAQLMQGDISNWINTTTNAFNYTGLMENMKMKAGSFYVGYQVPQQWIA